MNDRRKVIAFATKGTGTNEEGRLKTLLQNVDSTFLGYDKSKKIKSFFGLLRRLRSEPPSLIVMEGTGIAGGMACLIGRLLWRHRYVFSSGDAVGPFVGAHFWGLGWAFGLYERVLCRACSGFIGWTPYLVGRALTFGAPGGVTAAGWVIGENGNHAASSRCSLRRQWGVGEGVIVFGIVGAIQWSRRRQYCYGLELVRAIRKTSRQDIAVVVIGDGSGLERLREEAGDDLGRRIFLPGSVPLDEVMSSLFAMDMASLPQSTDAVGAFRYTTKISEYRSANLPIVTLRIPAAYDLNMGKCFRLPGLNPWDPTFVDALAELMGSTTRQQVIEYRNETAPDTDLTFCRDSQVRRVTIFLNELLESLSQ